MLSDVYASIVFVCVSGLSVMVDKRITLGAFKEELEQYVHVTTNNFKVCTAYQWMDIHSIKKPRNNGVNLCTSTHFCLLKSAFCFVLVLVQLNGWTNCWSSIVQWACAFLYANDHALTYVIVCYFTGVQSIFQQSRVWEYTTWRDTLIPGGWKGIRSVYS